MVLTIDDFKYELNNHQCPYTSELFKDADMPAQMLGDLERYYEAFIAHYPKARTVDFRKWCAEVLTEYFEMFPEAELEVKTELKKRRNY